MSQTIFEQLSLQGSTVHKISESALHVSTSHIFRNGSPSIYVASILPSGRIRLDDQGRNLDLFLGNLPDPEDAERIMARLIKQSGKDISFEKHRIFCESTVDDFDLAIGSYVSVLSKITSYAPPNIALQQLDDILANLYEFLKSKYKTEILINSEVCGHSGIKHSFNFVSGTKLIDYAKPDPQKTGSLLRKMIDVKNSNDVFDFQIILDDSNEKLFKREGDIIAGSGLASIMPLSKTGIIHS